MIGVFPAARQQTEKAIEDCAPNRKTAEQSLKDGATAINQAINDYVL